MASEPSTTITAIAQCGKPALALFCRLAFDGDDEPCDDVVGCAPADARDAEDNAAALDAAAAAEAAANDDVTASANVVSDSSGEITLKIVVHMIGTHERRKRSIEDPAIQVLLARHSD